MVLMLRKKWFWITVVFLLILIVGPFFIPDGNQDDLVDARSLATSDSRFINIKGIDIHYLDKGSGDTTYLLFHGFGASTYSWRAIFDELSTHGRVVAFDRPAFGLTDRPMEWKDFNPYDPMAQVQITYELMNALAINQAVMVGHSAGGVVALNMATHYYERVKKLVLVAPAVYVSGTPDWIRFVYNAPQFDRLGPLVARLTASQSDEILKTAWHNPQNIPSETFEAYSQIQKIKNWDKALWYFSKSTYSVDFAKNLPSLSMPVMIVSGDDDKIVSESDSKRLHANIPNSKYTVMPNCGHLPHEEYPQQFMEILVDFAEELDYQ
jgi:pimeloyl-ACP methyl ester carboxylesterase